MPTRTLLDRLLADYALTGTLPAISGGDGTDENGDDRQDDNHSDDDQHRDDKSKPVTFTAEQQAEINRIVTREAKTAREKAIKAEQDRIKAEQDAADAERKRKADEERGAFDEVKASLTGERDAIKAEYEAAKAEYEAVKTYFESQYAAALKDLPEVIKAFAPGDDAAVTVKTDWLSKATEQAKKLGTTTNRGNGPNPPPGGPPKDKIESPLPRGAILNA